MTPRHPGKRAKQHLTVQRYPLILNNEGRLLYLHLRIGIVDFQIPRDKIDMSLIQRDRQ
jgi:hypothetical protein